MADTTFSSALATEINNMCPSAQKAALGTAVLAAVNALGVSASDTTISITDGTDSIAIGSATAGAVTVSSNSTITVGNAEANSLTLSGGAGLASLDGTTVAVGPATTSTIAIGSATAGAVTVSSNGTITVGNAEATSVTIGHTSAGATSITAGGAITIGDGTATDSVTITSAGALDLAKAGQVTTVKGTLNVDQAASFDTTVQIGTTATAALAIGGGTSGSPLTSASTSKNFGGFWTQSTDATGTDMRGLYWRHYLAGAGGAQSGEAARFYTTVSASAANAARGAHISLDFGASGDITGLGAALDATLHVPDGDLGGTVAAVSADIHGDGANSNCTGTASFIRCSLQGTTTNLQDVYLFNIEGVSVGDGNLIETNTAADATHSLRCIIGGTVYYLLASTSP